LCCASDETIDHISLLCPYDVHVWDGVASLDYHFPAPALGLFSWWTDVVASLVGKRRKEENSLTMLVIRLLWLEINGRVFQGKEETAAYTLASVTSQILNKGRRTFPSIQNAEPTKTLTLHIVLHIGLVHFE
jgi:hypothetical protein